MLFRFSVVICVCLIVFSANGKCRSIVFVTGSNNSYSKHEAFDKLAFSQNLQQPDTSVQKKKTEPSSIMSPKPEMGFIKKLFTTPSREEKAEKKEAKISREIKNSQTQIFGWYPSWMANKTDDNNYNLLTTLSFFSVDIYRDSINRQVSYFDNGIDKVSTKELFNRASAAGCRIDVTFMCKDRMVIDQILNDLTVQDSCINYIVKKMNSNVIFDGVCIVFENIPPNNSGSLVAFMSALKEALSSSKRALKFALPPKDYSNNFNIPKLNTVVDTYILMAYNYYLVGTEPGPVSPLDDKKRNLSIKISVRDYLNKGVPFKKLIVALPYYGIVWKKKHDDSGQYSFYKHWTYSQITKNIAQFNPLILYDTVSCTHYYSFELNGDVYKCYFDNDESLAKKYKWLIRQGVAGVGIWALGYDHGSKDFWKMIEKNFTVLKLNPLKKAIVINNNSSIDTVIIYKLVGDSLVKQTSLIKESSTMDTLFSQIINPDIDTSKMQAPKSWFEREKEDIKTQLGPLVLNKKVSTAVLLTLIAFGLIGIISSLSFASVRELLYITKLPVYIISNIALILTGIGLFAFSRMLKPDVNTVLPGLYTTIVTMIWVVLIFGWVLINLLSHKLLGTFSLKVENP
jgi:spore germination protein YaaH